jgi:arylsulfatase A-like enzyme
MAPNVVFLLLDAAGANHFSCYGHGNRTTPFIDELAADGVRYERAYSNSIFSLPSYGSIFTGEYPSEHGAVDWSQRIDRNELVSNLNDEGYTTRAVSTHLVSDQFGIGDAFDNVEMVSVGSRELVFEDDPVAEKMSEHGNKEGWSSEREKYTYFLRLLLQHPSYKSVVNGGAQLYRKKKRDWGWWDDDGGAQAVERAKSVVQDSSEPFFLFLNFVETHDPYRPPRDYIRRFIPEDVSFDEIREALEYSSVRATLGLENINHDERDILRCLYDAEIAYVDDQIRSFHEFLERNGYAEDTVFVVVSDHGDFFGEHGLWGHQGHVYNEVCHVPLVINYPWETGRTEEGVVELRQLCNHLTALAAGERTELDPGGEALVEYYGLDTQLSFVPWEEYPEVNQDEWGSYECGLVTERTKLLWNAATGTKLYDTVSGRGETEDIADSRPDEVERLKSRVIELVGTPADNHERYRSGDADGSLDFEGETGEDVQNRLRELGYIK